MSSIYIHIPYCHSKCAYCDFYSMPLRGSSASVIDSIIAEYAMRSDEISEPVRTIYIGGGTPSILPSDALSRLIEALPADGLTEFTIEANPEDITVDKVKSWADMGINRVSMGVQSLIDSELCIIGRNHTAHQAIKATDDIRDGGITNISLDLIYGLPTQTLESWQRSLRGVLSIRPEHLSAYILSYEPRTRLTAMLNQGKIRAISDDETVEMYRCLTDEARAHGYEHYEISNFALSGYRAKHNSSYWEGVPYLGLGPAAHSYDGKSRRANPTNIKQYIACITNGKTAYETETETKADRYNDLLITRLRTAKGLEFGSVPTPRRRQLITDAYPYLKNGQLVINDGYLTIPEQHWLISDSIIRELMC